MFAPDVNFSDNGFTGADGGPFTSFHIFSSWSYKLTYYSISTAAIVLDTLRPDTEALYLNQHPDFGYQGLKALVHGMAKMKQPVRQLRQLDLLRYGLGGVSKWSFHLDF